MSTVNDNTRIAKNALYLYGRMLLTVGVSLYTARVVIDVLGIANYGIYNVVGGIVAIFGFINGTMAGATQRFLNYEMGQGDATRLKQTFNSSLLVHIGIALLILLLGETIGLWFVNHKLVIAPGRMFAANVTYQLSLVGAIASVVQIPYMASVMAHERMSFYASVSIVNIVLKLAVALSIAVISILDTLIIYAILMAILSIVVCVIYQIYCIKLFPECRISFKLDKNTLLPLLKFSGWDIYGNLSYTTRLQGTIVILNRFGGSVLNAAGNLTLTVASTITSFAGSVTTAFRPQIIQEYARGNYERMLTLLYNCARYTTLLMGLLIIPIFIELHYLLALWLKEVPEYTMVFCRISLIAAFGELLISITCIGIHATGRIKSLSFISGSLYLLELPAMYWLLEYTGKPPMVYVVHCIFIAMILLTDMLILKHNLSEFSLKKYIGRCVFLPIAIISIVGLFISWLMLNFEETFLRVVGTVALEAVLLIMLTYFVVLDSQMRREVHAKINSFINRHIKKVNG